jgi:spore germination cell wall hydrolase CwlJ-like protein
MSGTSDREQLCLATAIYFESKGEPLSGQLAVARVVMNRANSGRFASTLCGVVTQAGQFSFVRGGALPAINPNSGSWRTAVAIAKIAQGDLWESKAEKALYFHARQASPGWRMARVGTIGNHVFYR